MTIIILVDNDPDFLNTRAEFLENAGYRVLKAYTLEQARQLLADARIHLAILDIRMENDDDEKDVSGLSLAKDPAFHPVPKIILTGYPTYQAVREALGPALDGLPPAVDFLSKQEGPETMIQAVERAFEQYVRINWDLIIRWDERERLSFPHLATLIEPDLDPACLSDRARELEDLFRKLFYGNRQTTIGRLLWHREGRVCTTVFAYSPEGALEQRLVTCGLRPQIEPEITRYREFAPKGGIGTVLAGSAETMHFAAVAYALSPEADLEQTQTFEAFYRTHKAVQVREVVENLFQTTLASSHQRDRILEETRSLGQLYRERLRLSPEMVLQEEFQRRMQTLAREALSLGPTTMEFLKDTLTLRFPNEKSATYPNPIPYLYGEAVGSDLPVVCRITPGTLSGDNILVDQNGRTWLTDFAQAGPAPLAWDFISLEATVRFDLVESIDLQALHHFEERLVAPARLNERLDIQDIDAPFRKALGVIQGIRRLAFPSAGGDSMLYYKGLLFIALEDAASYTLGFRHTRQELAHFIHALLAAAMIYSRVMEVTEMPSSEGSVRVKKGIEVHELNRQVWVEGRRIELSPSEFALLLYLYKHARQLCTRRSIVEEGLKEKYVGDDQEESRINTFMGRLRKKIEPDPDHPHYLRTVRGQGYMLFPGSEESS